MSSFLLVLSAPSGTGKTTIAKSLLAARDDIAFSVSATTRDPRAGERSGVDYHFLDRADFEQRIDKGEFLEWAEYSGNLYGTLVSEVEEILEAGQHVVMDVETQGARSIRQRSKNVVSIFILPPSTQALLDRLQNRRTESPTDLAARLQRAVEEIGEATDYDYIVINEDRTQAVADVARIIDAEVRRPFRVPGIDQLLHDLRDGLRREAHGVRDEKG